MSEASEPAAPYNAAELAARLTVVRWCVAAMQSTSMAQTVDRLLAGDCPDSVLNALAGLKKHSRPTICRWVKHYQSQGGTGLLKRYKGRKGPPQPWHAPALRLYQQPQKWSVKHVCDALNAEGMQCTYSQVVRFIRSLPVTLTTEHPNRVGRNHANNTLKHYVVRDYSDLPVGHYYVADGHTIDCYLSHPASDRLYRPELTVVMDMTSRFVVSYHLSQAESTVSTLQCIGKAIQQHDHVPPLLLMDNGCGFKSHAMTDDQAGYFAAVGIDTQFAHPGNPKSKPVERFFRTLRDRLDKTFPSYCGADMAADSQRAYLRAVSQKRAQPPTVERYQEALDDFIRWYNNEHHHRALDGQTPASVWAALERFPAHVEPRVLFELRRSCKVQRGGVTLDKRVYRHAVLLGYNGREVVVAYSLDDDSAVTVYHQKRALCRAALYHKKAALPASRIAEQRERAAREAAQRLMARAKQRELDAIEPVVLQDATMIAQLERLIAPLDDHRKDTADRAVDELFYRQRH